MDFIESILAGKANSVLSILHEELKRKTLEAVQDERKRVVSETFGGVDEEVELTEAKDLPKVHEHKTDHLLAGELYHHALYDHSNAVKNGHPGGGNLHQWADNYKKKMKKGNYDEKRAVHGLTHAIKRTEEGYFGRHAHKPSVSYSTRHAAATKLLPHVHNLIHGKDIHHGIDESTQKMGGNLQEVLVHGKKLTPAQHKEVLNAFVHRHTGEHKPAWAKEKMPNGNTYKPTHPTDKEWVHDHAFHVNKKTGHLSAKHQHAEPGFMAEASPAMAPQQAAPPRPPKMKEPAKAGKTGKFGKWSDNEEDRLPWPSDYGKRPGKSAISGFSEGEVEEEQRRKPLHRPPGTGPVNPVVHYQSETGHPGKNRNTLPHCGAGWTQDNFPTNDKSKVTCKSCQRKLAGKGMK